MNRSECQLETSQPQVQEVLENNDIHVRQWTQVTCVMAFTYQVCRRVLEARISQATTYSIV